MDDLEIHIKDNRNSLKIVSIQRPYPDSDNEWDRDTLNLKVIAHAGAFGGEYSTFTWSHELSNLLKLLNDINDRNYIFELREKTIRMEFRNHNTNNIKVNITVTDDVVFRSWLNFEIIMSAADLKDLVNTLEKILDKYPVQIKS